MPDFIVPIVRVGAVIPHPKADRLSLTDVDGCPCIVKRDDFKPGDLAVYIPVESVVPLAHPAFSFLKHPRVKAVRLREVFSMGLLLPVSAFPEHNFNEGQNVASLLGIAKYEEPEPQDMSCERDPGFMPIYDLENFRKYGRQVFIPGEEVVVTEKIHGENFRAAFHQGRLWVGSRGLVRKLDGNNQWVNTAKEHNFERLLSEHCPGVIIYGEVYGRQDLKYDAPAGKTRLRVFDAYDIQTQRFLDYDNLQALIKRLGLEPVPELFRGQLPDPQTHKGWWQLLNLANGKSTLADCIREGWVMRPVTERYSTVQKIRESGTTEERIRAVLKYVGEDYQLRKGGTERH